MRKRYSLITGSIRDCTRILKESGPIKNGLLGQRKWWLWLKQMRGWWWQKRESAIRVMDATRHSRAVFFFLQERELFPSAVWRRRYRERNACPCRTGASIALVLPVTWTIGHSYAYKTVSPARTHNRCSWKHVWRARKIQQFATCS